jgi:molybdate transport repressor ModE-like protein
MVPEVRRYFKEVRFRQLRALMEVAETGSFTDAAERLGLSIPSVWQQIRALEDEFELELVVQSGKGVRLTAEAEEMVRMVAPLVEGFDQIRERFGNRSGQREKRVVVATTPSLLSNELRMVVARYRRDFPEVRLSFLERPSREVFPLLLEGEADVAILGLADEVPRLPNCEYHHWLDYPFVVMYPDGHAFGRRKTLDFRALSEQPLLLPNPSTNSRLRVDHCFAAAGVGEVKAVIESANALVLAGYVRMGLGVALTSISPLLLRDLERGEGERVAWRDVSPLVGSDSVYVVRRMGRFLPQHVADFRDRVLEARPWEEAG